MSKTVKFASFLILTGSVVLSMSSQSHALSVISSIEPQAAASDEQAGQYSASAFSTDAAGKGLSSGLLLSAEEVKHIRWCAERYISYHASDNTYEAASGQRLECKSN